MVEELYYSATNLSPDEVSRGRHIPIDNNDYSYKNPINQKPTVQYITTYKAKPAVVKYYILPKYNAGATDVGLLGDKLTSPSLLTGNLLTSKLIIPSIIDKFLPNKYTHPTFAPVNNVLNYDYNNSPDAYVQYPNQVSETKTFLKSPSPYYETFGNGKHFSYNDNQSVGK